MILLTAAYSLSEVVWISHFLSNGFVKKVCINPFTPLFLLLNE